jgi:hypothetical protein
MNAPEEREPEPKLAAAYETFVQFVRLTREKRSLAAQLKTVEEQLDRMEPQLRDYMGSEGFEKVKVEGCTIYLRPSLWGRPKEGVSTSAICLALKLSGLEEFVKERYSAKQISSHLEGLAEAYKEELADGTYTSVADVLPEELRAVLDIEPQQSIVVMERK